LNDVFDSLCDIDTYTDNIRHECYHGCNFIELCVDHDEVERECFLEKVEKVSKKHTDIIITIHGHGNKFGDLFRSPFSKWKNGLYENRTNDCPRF
jgi:hypothetical protein